MRPIMIVNLFVFLGLMSTVMRAADIPTEVIGAEDYNKEMCVQQYTDNCINTVCITSTAMDCQDQCQTQAQDKCEEQMEE